MIEPTAYQLNILLALQRLRRPGEIYAGTATAKVKARRRAANKAARVTRRVNR